MASACLSRLSGACRCFSLVAMHIASHPIAFLLALVGACGAASATGVAPGWRLDDDARNGITPRDRSVDVGRDWALRTRVLTRAPAPAALDGPTQPAETLAAGGSLSFLADYRLHGSLRPLRLSGGISLHAPVDAAPPPGGRAARRWSRAAAVGSATLSSYLGLGFRQDAPGDRGWNLHGDLGLSLARGDAPAPAAVLRPTTGGEGVASPLAVDGLLAERKSPGLRIGPQLSLGASYRY